MHGVSRRGAQGREKGESVMITERYRGYPKSWKKRNKITGLALFSCVIKESFEKFVRE
jgi:hypothetical protein